jgi:hypothetical protein
MGPPGPVTVLPLPLPLHEGVRLHAFLILATHGYEWLPSRLGRFDSWEGRVKLGDPGPCEVKKMSPPVGVRTSIPETSYYTHLSQ